MALTCLGSCWRSLEKNMGYFFGSYPFYNTNMLHHLESYIQKPIRKTVAAIRRPESTKIRLAPRIIGKWFRRLGCWCPVLVQEPWAGPPVWLDALLRHPQTSDMYTHMRTMYGMFSIIYLHNWVILRVNVGTYSIHGVYGIYYTIYIYIYIYTCVYIWYVYII